MSKPEILPTWDVMTDGPTLMNFLNTGAFPNQCVVLYFAQLNCVGCDQIRDYMMALPNNRPDVACFQIPQNSAITKNNIWCNDVMIYPTVKLFKNFPANNDVRQIIVGANSNLVEQWLVQNFEPLQ
ncbi:hypothetical protein PPL_12189 [Heterostelium album PN500]|uniref:Thioredoxin domain-containing protein n=1 Tax=Heterostelium pallidum (strain ATCC 26659 / Pp 5 / PN500) TaxID=670386 RepID=D3BLY4_HETP5|nr:hypothetical protein PPL_12189 [Heterostelium album PN500]EFA77585.1 hypothetical protein PPL_12189 [Heterostelium album PN500]|eukprot:XP_020429713.1 hypothetical protein PPL_12189 [Heterostelium album PN500]